MKHQYAIPALILIGGVIGYGAAPRQTTPIVGTTSGKTRTTRPVIRAYGKVVKLPEAAQQPRNGSKIVVDITRGGDPGKLNPALEKVCRYVNIYSDAGKRLAKVDIAVVLHGETTLTVLNADAYSARFKTRGNPSLDCLRALTKVGVRVFVCGQSLLGKGAKTSEVSRHAEVAVSALTTLVNLQADGYAYVALPK